MDKKIEDYKHSTTVGELLKHIKDNNIPDDAKILVERVTDFYYDKNNWQTFKKPNFIYGQAEQWNKDIDSGKYLDKEQYPNIIPEKHLNKYSEEDLESLKSEYTVVWSPVLFTGEDEEKHLFLNLHY